MKTIVLVLLTLPAFSQSILRSVIAGGGDFIYGSASGIEWTLGEIATERYDHGLESPAGSDLGQGFHQGFARLLDATHTYYRHVDLQLFPNPVYTEMHLRTDDPAPLGVRLYDMTGTLLARWSDLVQRHTFHLQQLSPGPYLLQVRDRNGILGNFLFQKI